MSEKITPQEASETSAQNYEDHNDLVNSSMQSKGLMDHSSVTASEMQARLDNIAEDYSQSNPGISEVSPKQHQEKLEHRKNINVGAVGKYAVEIMETQLALESNVRLAANHVAENQGAYIDAALAEASHDGVQINIQQSAESAQPVEVHVPQR